MPKILSVYNNKGGVGKTHLCVNLAAIYSKVYGMKTLLIDLDPQSNATHFLIKDKDSYFDTISELLNPNNPLSDINRVTYQSDDISNLFIVPASPDLDDAETEMLLRQINENDDSQQLVLSKYLEPVKDNYDIIIIDLHPSKKRLLNINALCASTHFACPVDSDPESFEGLNGLMETYKTVLPYNEALKFIGVIYMKFRNTNADFKALTVLSDTLNDDDLLFETFIPLRAKAVDVRWLKKPLILYAPSDDCTKSYVTLADEIKGKMEM